MRTTVILALLLTLSACDPMRVAKLEEGVSTEAQVRQEFGEPATLTINPDGTRVLDFPRQPEGWTNYRITIGADGKMSSLRQLLHADNFARVLPGQTQDEVRERLGRTSKVMPWPLKNETEWVWRFQPGPNDSKLFSVYFGADGRVLRTAIADDPRTQAQTGN